MDWIGDHALQLFVLGSVVLFIFYPLFCVFLRSFHSVDGFTISQYAKVITDESTALWRSVFVGSITSVLCTILSVVFALFISTRRGWQKYLFMALLIVIMVSPPFVSSLSYIQLYGRRGWITYNLLHLNIMPYNQWGIIAMQTISFVPINTLLLNGLLAKIDRSVINSARDLGARAKDILKDIIIPSLKPGIIVCLLLTFVRSLADYGTPAIIGGRFRTLATQIYIQFMGAGDIDKAAAMNMFLLVPSLILFFIYRHYMKKMNSSSARSQDAQINIPLSKGGIIGWLIIGASLLYSLIMTLQYASIFLSAVNRTGSKIFSFTTEYIEKVFTYNASTLYRSLLYAFIVSIIGSLFAIIFSYYIERRKVRFNSVFDCIVTLPYMIPGTCFGIGYILAFNHGPLKMTGTALILIINMLFKQLPTTTKMCAASLSQINIAQENSARDLGAGRLAVIKDVILPGMRPAMLTCFIYNFTSSMTTAGAILFLVAPKTLLAVFKLFDATYTGEYGVAAVIASLIIIVVLLVEGLVFLLTSYLEKHNVSGTRTYQKELW
ncbi:MAG: iron ABC transporter permease [Dehalococcoidales bacterium]|nr:iron ABC transporter permease [Dehalococcoidales bacterium]